MENKPSHPPSESAWEFEYLNSLILGSIPEIKNRYPTLVFNRLDAVEVLSAEECLNFVIDKLESLAEWAEYMKGIFTKDLNEACGKLGEDGEKKEIEEVASKLVLAMQELIRWEVSLSSVVPVRKWEKVFQLMRGSSINMIEDVENFFERFDALIKNPPEGVNRHQVLEFRFPPKMENLDKELKKAARASLPKELLKDIGIEVLKKCIGI